MNKKILILVFGIFLVLAGGIIISSTSTPDISLDYDFTSNESKSFGEFGKQDIFLEVDTPNETNCYYGSQENQDPSNPLDNYGIKHKKVIDNLGDGYYKYYIQCGQNNSNPIIEISFGIVTPLKGEVRISENPPLSSGTYEIELITSRKVSETPDLSYSLDDGVSRDINLKGSGKNWEGYLIIPEGSGEKTGSFSFSARGYFSGETSNILNGDTIFIVDTTKPKTVEVIDTVGQKNRIKLEWYFENDVEEFNIYRSDTSGVDYTDYYTNTENDKVFYDDIPGSKTYYYRIAAVDEAGNIGELSREVYGTSLISNNSVSGTGLNPKFVGKVDNKITEIELIKGDLETIKSSLNEKSESDLFEALEINEEIDGVLSELNSLKRDVENYKSQNLAEEELDKKLNSVSLRLNILKKRAPEDIIVIDEKTITRELSEEVLERALIEYDESFLESSTSRNLREVSNIIEEGNLNIESRSYNLEITYIDGSKKEITFVREILNSEIERDSTLEFVLFIPKNVAESVSDMKIMNSNYEIIKDDPVIAFGSDTKEISYYIEKELDLNSLDETFVAPVKIVEDQRSFITGNFIGNISTSGSLGIIILVVVAIGLGVYFIYLRKDGNPKNILIFLEKVKKVKELIDEGRKEEAMELYKIVKEDYAKLSEKDKDIAYKELQKVGLK